MNNIDGLAERKRTYELARKAVSMANKLGQPYQGRAISLLNKHRNELLWAQRGGRTPTYHPDFEMRVAGIPCGVVVTEHHYEEDDHLAFSFILINSEGYQIEWLERKADAQDVFNESIKQREAARYDY